MMTRREFSRVLLSNVQQFHNVSRIATIGSFRRLETTLVAFVTLCNVECDVAHILARKLHGWLGFRTEQGELFPRRRLFVSFDRSIFPCIHRVTRYAAWILTRRNCTYAQLWCNSFDNNARPDNKRWTLARTR